MTMFHERALPDLANNIKCGNSLIGPDFYDQQDLGLLDEEEQYRINVFDWQAEFPTIFSGKNPGFDAVIGNPPYIRIQAMKEWAPVEVEHYKCAYASAAKGNYDIYVVFVEKGLSLLSTKGRLGFILPHKFFNAQYGAPLRRLVANGKHLTDIVHFGDQQVFECATTYTCLLFLDKAGAKSFHVAKVANLDAWRTFHRVGEEGELLTDGVSESEWNFVVGRGAGLFERLNRMPIKLGDVADIFVGLQTSADKIYILEEVLLSNSGLINVRDRDGNEWQMESAALKAFLSHTTLGSYEKPESHHQLIFPYTVVGAKVRLIDQSKMIDCYPKTWEYLQHNSKALLMREGGNVDRVHWYGYIYRKNLIKFDSPKLIVQVISQKGRYVYDDTGVYFTGGGNGPYYGIRWLDDGNLHSIHYLQGLLNSNLLDFYLHRISTQFRGGYWSYSKRYLKLLPVRMIDFNDASDKTLHDRMVKLVERMLSMNKQLATAKTGPDKTMIQRQITATDRQIDRLVYELYDLTDEEIAIVEGRAAENEC